jgi:hypothetical protein
MIPKIPSPKFQVAIVIYPSHPCSQNPPNPMLTIKMQCFPSVHPIRESRRDEADLKPTNRRNQIHTPRPPPPPPTTRQRPLLSRTRHNAKIPLTPALPPIRPHHAIRLLIRRLGRTRVIPLRPPRDARGYRPQRRECGGRCVEARRRQGRREARDDVPTSCGGCDGRSGVLAVVMGCWGEVGRGWWGGGEVGCV